MGYPCWFILIKKWCELEGKTGLTLPFIYGALISVNKGIQLDSIVSEMTNFQDVEYALGISECSKIHAPVLSIFTKQEIISEWKYLPIPSTNPEPFFYYDQDLKWATIPVAIIENLLKDASDSVLLKKYSRQYDQRIQKYVYADFTNSEIEFIRNTLS
jgi:hypothetical protein